MTRQTTVLQEMSQLKRVLLAVAPLVVIALVAVGALLWRTGGDETFKGVPADDPGPIHVHGLGINPGDGALFIATHTGLYRLDRGESKAKRVAERHQDTMGFTVVGPDRFLGSGHPDLNEAQEKGLPSLLGLIESDDSGETWKSISLSGQADFHVLRSLGNQVYGYDSSNNRLLASADRGRSWDELTLPGPLLDLAASPRDPRRLVAATASQREQGLHLSLDGGESWSRLDGPAGLLAWPAPDQLYLLTGAGQVFSSPDGGARFEQRGELSGQPAAFLASGPDELYVALHDGTIEHSTDGGQTWELRSRP